MIYNVTINDKVYEVEVEKGKANLIRTTAVALLQLLPLPHLHPQHPLPQPQQAQHLLTHLCRARSSTLRSLSARQSRKANSSASSKQ